MLNGRHEINQRREKQQLLNTLYTIFRIDLMMAMTAKVECSISKNYPNNDCLSYGIRKEMHHW